MRAAWRMGALGVAGVAVVPAVVVVGVGVTRYPAAGRRERPVASPATTVEGYDQPDAAGSEFLRSDLFRCVPSRTAAAARPATRRAHR